MRTHIERCERVALTVLAVLTVAGCAADGRGAGHGHGEEAHDDHGHGDAPVVSRTLVSDGTELYVEFPPLAVGQRSPFAAHLTDLAAYDPVAEGGVVVTLSPVGGGKDERFEVIKPAQPGIFRPVVIPRAAGRHRVALRWTHGDTAVTFELGELEVAADPEHASVGAASEAAGEITLLKEQQWRIEFSVTPVERVALQPTTRVHGRLITPPEGAAVLTAPTAGRVAGAGLPAPGARIERDALVTEIAPALDTGTDRAGLQAAVQDARLTLAHAEQELERMQGLFDAGAIAERRLTEARLAVERARVSLNEARRRSGQQRRALETDGGDVSVRATVAGVVSKVLVVPGAAVEQGQPLLEIVNPDLLWLEVRVPEHELAALRDSPGGWFEVAGSEARFGLDAEQRQGSPGPVDSSTRTSPMWFAVDDPRAAQLLRTGMSAIVHLASEPPVEVLAVPREAVIHDAGQTLVFVQRTGESFERRAVTVGRRGGDRIEIVDGLEAGARVVVDGAWVVKLAASGGAVPDHGHAH